MGRETNRGKKVYLDDEKKLTKISTVMRFIHVNKS